MTDVHLSIVATSRNDNHGGDLLDRMQRFIDGLVEQCRRHGVSAELVLVEWNPPADRPPLAAALRWPLDTGPCAIRIVTVPASVHDRLAHADQLPLFQMIAKNVGIRRARGRFVLATNIDILFADEVMLYMRDRLEPGHLYRVDRCDVPTDLPSSTNLDQVLAFCRHEAMRVNRKEGTFARVEGRWVPPGEDTALGPVGRWLTKHAGRARAVVHPLLLRGRWLKEKVARVPFRTRYIARRLAERLAGAAVLTRRAPRAGLAEFGRVFAIVATYPFLRLGHLFGVIPLRRAVGGNPIPSALPPAAVEAEPLASVPGATVPFQAATSAPRVDPTWTAHWLTRWRRRFERPLHTNACGDFTLIAREDWAALRGYPEWPIYSWHIDSVLLYQADRNGIREVDLPSRFEIYHIEHAMGSGYTPEGANQLFQRLAARGIPYLSWDDLMALVTRMDELSLSGRSVIYNGDDWGLADLALPETIVAPRPQTATTSAAVAD